MFIVNAETYTPVIIYVHSKCRNLLPTVVRTILQKRNKLQYKTRTLKNKNLGRKKIKNSARRNFFYHNFYAEILGF